VGFVRDWSVHRARRQLGSSKGDQTVLQQCDVGCSEPWNNGDNDDEAPRDVVDYGMHSAAASRPAAGGHGGELASQQNDVNVRFVLTRPQTVEMMGLLSGGLSDSITSSRDFLVATDTATGQHVGNHGNGNAHGDDDDEE